MPLWEPLHLRDAENRDDFLQRAQERLGLTIDVIPGEEEARLSYLAVRRDPQWRSQAHLRVIDIGGGSTEIIEGTPNGNDIASRISVNYGAVRLTEQFLRSDPPTVQQLEEANLAVMKAFARIDEEAHHSAKGGKRPAVPDGLCFLAGLCSGGCGGNRYQSRFDGSGRQVGR